MPKPSKKTMGAVKPWTEEELEELSQITEADIQAAQAFVSGTRLGALLEAQPVEEEENAGPE